MMGVSNAKVMKYDLRMCYLVVVVVHPIAIAKARGRPHTVAERRHQHYSYCLP